MSRRDLLRKLGLAALAPVALLTAEGASADPQPRLVRVFRLDPNASSDGKSQGCRACKACLKHAANQYFLSPDAVRRAHPGCRCGIRAEMSPLAAAQAMFLPGTAFARARYDARWL